MGEGSPILDRLRAQFADDLTATSVYRGDISASVVPQRIADVARFVRDDAALRFDLPVDVTAVDYLGQQPRFEVVYHLYSTKHHHRLRLKARVPEDNPTIPSVTPVWAGANWLEREVYDMFGVVFAGHPDLRRILMWETYAEGHPLRKDFPLRGRFSRAEQVRQALNANPEANYSIEELSIAEAFDELPADMRERLRTGQRGGLTGAGPS